jgi:hypothetical protein
VAAIDAVADLEAGVSGPIDPDQGTSTS